MDPLAKRLYDDWLKLNPGRGGRDLQELVQAAVAAGRRDAARDDAGVVGGPGVASSPEGGR